MDSVVLAAGPIHLGLDVSKDKIAVGILRWEERVPDTELIFNDEASVRRLVPRFGDPGGLRGCYEAGPARVRPYPLLGSVGGGRDVGAPAVVPHGARRPGRTDPPGR